MTSQSASVRMLDDAGITTRVGLRHAVRRVSHVLSRVREAIDRVDWWLSQYRFRCLDCGKDTSGDDYYSVHDEVWEATGLGPDDGMLCRHCLSDRLGRPLTEADFPDCPVNDRHRPRLPAFDAAWRSGGIVESLRVRARGEVLR